MANVPYLCRGINHVKMNKEKLELFKEHFMGIDLITLDDIRAYCCYGNPNINDVAVRKDIYNLKKNGIIISLKRGIYKIAFKPLFRPVPDSHIKRIHKLFTNMYPDLSYCIWSTQWLHQFMNLQPLKHFYVIETEKDILESVYFLLKENKINAFLKPDKNMAEKYMAESELPVIIKLMTSRSPVIQLGGIKAPTLEKILIDVFSDSDVFFFYQGNELWNIFNNALRYFLIDYSKLLNYADRRKQKNKIISYLKTNFENVSNDLIL